MVAHPTIHLIKCFVMAILSEVQTSSTPRSETAKTQCGKGNMETLLWQNISSSVPCHPSHFASGASGVCRRTHFALFRWAITQKSLCLAQQRSTDLKISPRECVIFCVISMGPLGMYISLRKPYFNVKVAKG